MDLRSDACEARGGGLPFSVKSSRPVSFRGEAVSMQGYVFSFIGLEGSFFFFLNRGDS